MFEFDVIVSVKSMWINEVCDAPLIGISFSPKLTPWGWTWADSVYVVLFVVSWIPDGCLCAGSRCCFDFRKPRLGGWEIKRSKGSPGYSSSTNYERRGSEVVHPFMVSTATVGEVSASSALFLSGQHLPQGFRVKSNSYGHHRMILSNTG